MDLILDEDMGCISGIEVGAGVGVEGSGVIGPREKNWCKIQLFSIIRDVNACNSLMLFSPSSASWMMALPVGS
jgi:hypothetical protein